jgi:hypothetical protein
MASTSSTNPAYSVPAFNGHERLVRIHQEITDLLHYQSHVRLAAASHLPPGTRSTNQQEREAIIKFLKEERARIWTLLRTTTSSSKGSTKTHRSPLTQTGERSHGDPCRNGKSHRQQMTRHQHSHQPASGSSSAPHSKCCHSYNPHAEESDYDDNETPEIGDIHRDEVYNNID